MRGITRDTLVEMFDRKLFYVFAAVTALSLLVVLLTGSFEMDMSIDTNGEMDAEMLNEMLGDPIIRVFEFYLSFLVFLAVMGTAGLIPNILEKGRADYYLSKPLSRTALFLNKFFGILIVYGLTIMLSGVIIYAAVGLVHDLFNARIIYLFLFSMIAFFIWLSITAFAGVAFGSNAIALMSAFIIWILQKILAGREILEALTSSKIIKYIVDTLYYIIPKTGGISDIAIKLTAGRPVNDWMPFYSSFLFALALLYVTIVIFKLKNY